MGMSGFGRFLATAGVVLFVVGVLLMFFPNIPFLGKLPGDIHIEKDNFSFYFPLTTCILLSILFSIILMFLKK